MNRRSNVSATKEDEGIQLQPRCYTQLGERVTGGEGDKIRGCGVSVCVCVGVAREGAVTSSPV